MQEFIPKSNTNVILTSNTNDSINIDNCTFLTQNIVIRLTNNDTNNDYVTEIIIIINYSARVIIPVNIKSNAIRINYVTLFG